MGYTRDAIKGVSWLGGFRIFMRGLSYIKLAIIARILTPAQFGVADIALVILAFIEILTETGINIFLIQEKDDIDSYIDTAWVVSIIRGLGIALIIFFSAPFISSFFRSSESLSLLWLISIVPFLRGFINPAVAKFLKNLQYNKEFFYRSSIFFIETLIIIVAVLLTESPIGIIWGLIAGAIFEVMLSFLIVKPIPSFSFKKQYFQKVIERGKWLTVAGICNYLYHNVDNIFVGRMLGTSSLGLYMRAYNISMLPITEISDVFSRTTFPIYVKMANDRQRLRSAFLKTITFISVLVIPAGLIFYFFPEEIIKLLLGDKWINAAAVLQVLALFGVLKALANATSSFFYSIQRQDIVTKISFLNLIGLLITIVPFIQQWGIIGAAYSALFGTIITMPVILYFLYKTLK